MALPDSLTNGSTERKHDTKEEGDFYICTRCGKRSTSEIKLEDTKCDGS